MGEERVQVDRTVVRIHPEGRRGIIEWGDVEIRTPYSIRSVESCGDGLIVQMFLTTECADPDFELPTEERNVVRVDPDGTVAWYSAPLPPEIPAEDRLHGPLIKFDGRIVSRFRSIERFYEIDPDTGEYVDDWHWTSMKIGPEMVEFGSEVMRSFEFDDVIVIKADNLYGFDSEGNRLWRRDQDGPSFRVATVTDEEPRLYVVRQMGDTRGAPWEKYRLNSKTGLIAEANGSLEIGE